MSMWALNKYSQKSLWLDLHAGISTQSYWVLETLRPRLMTPAQTFTLQPRPAPHQHPWLSGPKGRRPQRNPSDGIRTHLSCRSPYTPSLGCDQEAFGEPPLWCSD